jgi:methylenetetrahydrofolate dehydrogenase (NADP+)/methenyltetrahydrofolate cyclohydrolase
MIIDGKKIAEEINIETAKLLNGAELRLTAVLVGDDAGNRRFLELKKIAAEKLGIDFRLYEFPENITTQKLRKEIVGIAKAGVNDGVIIELPLPAHINTQYILNAVPPEKDPDVLSEKAMGAFFAGRSPVLPPSVEAVKTILERHDIKLKGKNCAVFGYGILVGKPVVHWLASQNGTVSIINEFTLDPIRYSLSADIIISGVGKPNLVTADMVKKGLPPHSSSECGGAVVIDFGFATLNGKMTGDVDFESVSKKASLVTPVPGGVGPIVTASVLRNLVVLNKKVA